MGEVAERSGRCLCGSVRITARSSRHEMDVCHCSICQLCTAGVFLAAPRGRTLRVEDESELGVSCSSDYGERLFRPRCGTSLAWRMRGLSHSAVSVKAFEERGDFVFAEQTFVDDTPATDDFANDTRKLTGAEVFAQFGASQGV